MPRADSTWTAAPQSVRGARKFVQEHLEGWGADELVWPAATLVSELATNAVLHARTDFTVDIEFAGGQLTIRVEDSSPGVPVRRQFADEAATGRGLALLQALASDWGIVSTPSGKIVWCTVAAADRSGSAPLPPVPITS